MQVYGYIRFSFLGQSDTKLSSAFGADRQSYFNMLYDPERMARRFHLFERITLPSLKAQSDPDFTAYILSSAAMPEEYKARLDALTKDVPQLVPVYSTKPSVLHACRPLVRQGNERAKGPSIHFRLDDDDAMGADAIGALKDMGKRAAPETILSLPLGNMLFEHGGACHAVPMMNPYIGAAWARVTARDDLRSPFKFAHFNSAHRFPTMTDPRVLGYTYTLHDGGDTAARLDERIPKLVQHMAGMRASGTFDLHKAQTDAAFPGTGYQGLCDALWTLPDAAGKTASLNAERALTG